MSSPMREPLGKHLGSDLTERLLLLFLETLEVPQNRVVEVQGRSGHDAVMLYLNASDVNKSLRRKRRTTGSTEATESALWALRRLPPGYEDRRQPLAELL